MSVKARPLDPAHGAGAQNDRALHRPPDARRGISYGVSSYGYDIRVADEFRIFTNVNSTIVDPSISIRAPWSTTKAIPA